MCDGNQQLKIRFLGPLVKYWKKGRKVQASVSHGQYYALCNVSTGGENMAMPLSCVNVVYPFVSAFRRFLCSFLGRHHASESEAVN